MRVAIVVGDLFGSLAAVGRVAQFEATALAKAGHDVVCVTATAGDLPATRVEVVGRWISRLDALRRVSAEVSFAGGAGLALRRLQPLDLIVVHGGGPCLAALPFGRRHGIPTVFVIHAMIWDRIAGQVHALRMLDLAFYRAADRVALRADFTLSVSEYIRAVAVRHGATPSRALVRRNPVDTTTFTPGRGDRPVDVLYVGRLSPEKGVDTFVDAAGRLPPLRMVAIGDGRMRGMLEQRAQGRVAFVGPMDIAALADQYRRAKICVVPSRSDSFPLVVLEALASGTPVVGANVGGIPELIVEGETGWLVPSGDPEALARTIVRALSCDLAAYAVRARAAAETDSLERFQEHVPIQYERIVELHRAAAASDCSSRRTYTSGL
jgi:D-inositol-3-phosphate glycosyltransferase